MFDDAVTELTAIEAEMQVKNELPVDFVIGAGPF